TQQMDESPQAIVDRVRKLPIENEMQRIAGVQSRAGNRITAQADIPGKSSVRLGASSPDRIAGRSMAQQRSFGVKPRALQDDKENEGHREQPGKWGNIVRAGAATRLDRLLLRGKRRSEAPDNRKDEQHCGGYEANQICNVLDWRAFITQVNGADA